MPGEWVIWFAPPGAGSSSLSFRHGRARGQVCLGTGIPSVKAWVGEAIRQSVRAGAVPKL
ncbi:hypothetical protein Slala05_78780 [Streptomyces lavendulae subsp. lavendulae]|nr:hypothetical protein Slala05_78780 [Streptomyces lavendulae subsp. lavendulae]